MKSTITITPTTNIDFDKMEVIDSKKIEVKEYDGLMDVFTFYNEKAKETRKGTLINVSLYDDVIVDGDVHYKILHMLSKG